MTRPARASAVPLALAVCAVAVAGGFALKAQCLTDWVGFVQYERLCYNDIQPLYGARHIDSGAFPYVNGSLDDGELVGGAIEYPVLTGVFMWAGGLLVDDVDAYLVVSAIMLAPFALVVAYLLARMRGRTALMWAAAPALVLYSFHNWDLLVVAAAVGGIYAWWRGRSLLAAALFGVGGALKAYPLLFLPALALERWFAGERREAGGVVAAGVGVFALANLPFIVANPSGWWATFDFHRLRGPNFDNIWAIREFGPLSLPMLEPEQLNLVTAVLTGGFIAIALTVGVVRARRSGAFPFLAVAAACLASFLLWNKVHSPQYALWILPFFALLRVHPGWWVAYSVVDLAVYVGVFRFFFEVCSADPSCAYTPGAPSGAERLMDIGVFGRAGLLLVLFAVFLRARPDPVASHPPPRVSVEGDRRPG
ncbi:MAG TPA: glycosyltransferase 87 family protein [Actinomycetota bacterium]|jgi:uncharacterized membrane protein|nr:glycosyltransferase 87 family protein [Actinomycetota bacterium]